MNPITVSVGPLTAASANAIALTQTPVKGPLTLNGATVTGGVAVLDHAREVLITTSADESTHTFTITGTDIAGSAISEVVTGVNNSTVASQLNYLTVSSIVISANAAGALSVGTNAIAASAWVRFDGWAAPSIAVQANVSGTVNYTIQQTLDDPNSPTNPVSPSAVTWVNNATAGLVGASSTQQGSYTFIPTFARVLLNSGNGTVTATFLQATSVPY